MDCFGELLIGRGGLSHLCGKLFILLVYLFDLLLQAFILFAEAFDLFEIVAHDSFESCDFSLELFDLGATCREVFGMFALLFIEFADQALHFHTSLIVLLHQRVIFQVDLLTLILREVIVELIELIGKEELIIGEGKAVGASLRFVDSYSVAVVADYQHYYQGDKSHQCHTAGYKNRFKFLIHDTMCFN